jgi:hypothetical protein
MARRESTVCFRLSNFAAWSFGVVGPLGTEEEFSMFARLATIVRTMSLRSAAALCCLTGVAAPSMAQPGSQPGACCLPPNPGAVTCQTLTFDACAAAGGLFRGPGTVCSNSICSIAPPPPPTSGACCARNAAGGIACSIRTTQQCAQVGGVFIGANTTCTNTSCPTPAPRGACCIAATSSTTGGCIITDRAQCAARNGTYLGDNAPCSPDACPRPVTGACCNPALTGAPIGCVITTAAQCTQIQGTFQGDNSVCSSTSCPAPARGACCRPVNTPSGGGCVLTTADRCTLIGGTYAGDSTTCAATTCARVCPCDWNADGVLNSSDLVAFVNDFVLGNADYNRDGATNQLDLIDFINCFTRLPGPCRPTTGPRPGSLAVPSDAFEPKSNADSR